MLDDGGHSPASNRDATVASRPKTKPKDGEGSGENEDPEQAKLQVGLNSAIVREKPNVKLNDITRLSPLDQVHLFDLSNQIWIPFHCNFFNLLSFFHHVFL